MINFGKIVQTMKKIMVKLENQEQVPAIMQPESVLVFSE